MSWAHSSDYFEAIQYPLRCFQDADLRRGQPAVDAQGKPVCRKGACADVYEIRCPGVRERWAVKCYLREMPGLQEHYQALHDHLLRIDFPFLAACQYLQQGIDVRGRWYPVVKMPWIDGTPLNEFVRDYADQPEVLGRLAEQWLVLSRALRRALIAHGNLQHEHILVCRAGSEGSLKLRLVDYDGVFVPALAGNTPHEVGHVNYEHPQRIWQKCYDVEMDRFAELAIYTALQALSVGGRSLWQRFDTGSNVLFCEADFQEPATSAALHELWRAPDAAVRALVGQLILASQGPLGGVPRLEELQALFADRQSHGGAGLTQAQGEQIEAFLGSEPPPADNKKTQILPRAEIDAHNAATTADNFDLVVDYDPNLVLPSPPPLPLPAVSPVTAGSLPVLPTRVSVSLLPEYDPTATDYHLDAWMPERVAVVKLRGFVQAHHGEVIASEPGLVRVHLLDPLELLRPRGPKLLSWMGLSDEPPPHVRILGILELFMQHKDTAFQKLLAMTIRVKPGDDGIGDQLEWQRYSDRIFCELRGFLMGKNE